MISDHRIVEKLAVQNWHVESRDHEQDYGMHPLG